MLKIKSNKYIKIFIIPSFLFLLWVVLTFFQIISNDGSPTVLTKKYSQQEFPKINNDPILSNEKRTFEFTATHNNLGYISINFDVVGKGREDYIDLLIYEKGTKNIIKEETTFAGAFQGLNFYPFGFPIISDSKRKTYIVEITSKNGTQDNHVAIKDAKSFFSASYQYDKNLIKSSPPYLIDYAITKAINSLENNFLLFASSVYLYPFIFYIFWLFAEKYFKKKSLIHNPIIAMLGISVLTDIFFVDQGFDLVFLLIPLLWGFMLFYLKKDSTYSYKVALGILILCPILQLLGQDVMVEKSAAWAFLALAVGVIINVYELKKNSKKFN
jgi:hypothetical protein